MNSDQCRFIFFMTSQLAKEHIDNSLFLHTAHLIMNQCSTSFLLKLKHLTPTLWKWGDFSPCLSSQRRKLPRWVWKMGSFVMNTFQADWSHKTWYGQLTVTAFIQDWDGMKWNYITSSWKTFCNQCQILRVRQGLKIFREKKQTTVRQHRETPDYDICAFCHAYDTSLTAVFMGWFSPNRWKTKRRTPNPVVITHPLSFPTKLLKHTRKRSWEVSLWQNMSLQCIGGAEGG